MISLLLDSIYSLIYAIYFLVITYYIFTTLSNSFSKTTLLWLDNWYWYLSIIVILFLNFIVPLRNEEKDPSMTKAGRTVLFIVMLISTNNLLLNFPYTLVIYKQWRQLQQENLIKRTKVDIMNKKFHFSLQILVWVLNAIVFFCYVKVYMEDEELFYKGITIFQCFQLSLVLLSLVNIYCLVKLNLLCGEINENLLNNVEIKFHIKFHTTLFIYKTILDFITNVPSTIILLLGHFGWIIQILFYIIILSHMIFTSNLLFYYDQCNGIYVSRRVRNLFFSKCFKHSFGYTSCRRSSNSTFTRLSVSNAYTNEEGSHSVIYNDESNVTNNLHKFIMNYNDQRESKDYLAVNFLIIFKLLFQIFKNNEKCFETVERKIAEDRLSIRNASIRDVDKIESVLSNISRISKLPFENKNKSPKTHLTFKLNEILNSLEDKKAKEQFHKSISNLDHIVFKIEYYHIEIFIELLPIFQILLKDVLESLNPSKNLGICKTLYEKKCGDANYTHFYTMDTFLNFEVYDREEFISPELLNNFVTRYHKYITDTVKNWKFTFLPPILGIFRISYLDYDKIIVLYRHPLAFSPFLLFKYWINLSLSDEEEKVTISSNFSEVIDVKEIEIKDNIRLNIDDYGEHSQILEDDLRFLRSIQYELRNCLNIFIINELRDFVSVERMFHESYEDISAHERNTLLSALQKTELFRDTVTKNIEKSKMLFGSETMSSIEKILVNYMVNTRYVIKVYISDLFRSNRGGLMNKDEVDSHNKAYCEQ